MQKNLSCTKHSLNTFKTSLRLKRSCFQHLIQAAQSTRTCLAWFNSNKLLQSTKERFSLQRKNSHNAGKNSWLKNYHNQRRFPKKGEKLSQQGKISHSRKKLSWHEKNSHDSRKILTTEQEKYCCRRGIMNHDRLDVFRSGYFFGIL